MIDDPSKRSGAPTGAQAQDNDLAPGPAGTPARSTNGSPPIEPPRGGEDWASAEAARSSGSLHRLLVSDEQPGAPGTLIELAERPEVPRRPELAEQLAYDAELVRRFRASNCTCREWGLWLHDLIKSTTGLLINWCKRGLIFKKTHSTPWPREGTLRSWDMTELRSLVGEMQAGGVKLLRDKGIRGRHWDPKKGATLRGYFLRGCLHAFADRWPKWSRDHEKWARLDVHPDVLQLSRTPIHEFTGYEFDDQALIGLLRRVLTNEQFEVLAANAEGYTNVQMAEIFGVSPNAIAQRLRRAKIEARKHFDEIKIIEEGGSHA